MFERMRGDAGTHAGTLARRHAGTPGTPGTQRTTRARARCDKRSVMDRALARRVHDHTQQASARIDSPHIRHPAVSKQPGTARHEGSMWKRVSALDRVDTPAQNRSFKPVKTVMSGGKSNTGNLWTDPLLEWPRPTTLSRPSHTSAT